MKGDVDLYEQGSCLSSFGLPGWAFGAEEERRQLDVRPGFRTLLVLVQQAEGGVWDSDENLKRDGSHLDWPNNQRQLC